MTTDQPQDRLRLARRLAGPSQEEAARLLGVSVRTYSRWERGESEGWLDHLDKIAELFSTTADEILGTTNGGSDDRFVHVERQLAALAAEVRELRDLLLDPKRLRAEADRLIDEEGGED